MKKFFGVIGNPPYQETKGGTKNIDIWQDFVKAANEITDNSVFVHPGRWIVPKKNMEAVRDELINEGLSRFDFYPNSSALFKNGIDGGVAITCFHSDYEGDIEYSIAGLGCQIYKPGSLFFSNPYEIEIYEKLSPEKLGTKSIEHRIMGNVGSLGGGEYGYKKGQHIGYLEDTPSDMENPVAIWANSGYGKGTRFAWHYIDKKNLDDIPDRVLQSRKLMLDKKGHAATAGRGNIFNNIPKIVDKDAIASGDVFFVFPENDDIGELENLRDFFMTKTVRYLMALIQKDLYVRGFSVVPDYTYFLPLLNGQHFSDDWFYEKYGFSDGLIKDIESKISEKKDKELS